MAPLPGTKPPPESKDESSPAQTPFLQSSADEKSTVVPDAARPCAPPRLFPYSQQPQPFPPNPVTAPPSQDLKDLSRQLPPATVYLHQSQLQNPLQPNPDATVYIHREQYSMPATATATATPSQDLKDRNQQVPPSTVYLHQPQFQNPLQPDPDATFYIHRDQYSMPGMATATATTPGFPMNATRSFPAAGPTQDNKYPIYPPQRPNNYPIYPPQRPNNYPIYPPQGPIVVNRSLWNTDLFGCLEDPTLTLMTFFFPCVTFGQIAEIIDEGQTSCATNGMLYGLILFLIGLPCLISCGYRTRLRYRFGLDEAPAPDWLVHCFCEYCALCQAYRELNARQLNPALGWLGNQRLQAMTAPTAQVMMPRI